MKLDKKLGSGDGTNYFTTEEPPKKITPSSRRFSTKTLPTPTNKHKLQTAITEVSRKTSFLDRRKSLSLAEITPTRRTPSNQKVMPACKDVKAAGTLVYRTLLLNAWQKCRKERDLLVQSVSVMENQNKKLELQVDALHRLRTSESEKRNEAVTQAQTLQHQNEEHIKEHQRLLKDKFVAERDLKILQQKLNGLQLELGKVKNDLSLRQNELHKIECYLATERKKIKRLRHEKQLLIEQEFILKQELSDYNIKVTELQEKLLTAELLLQDNIFCKSNHEQEKNRLLKTLENERLTNREIKEEIYKLKFCLAIIKRVLKKRESRPWWKNATALGLETWNSLRSISHMLFPICKPVDL